ncbi:MAG: glycosyltransferase family 39 protein [Bacteroidia bacterium]|nr:glycosyltransferase family 39 protein [Bacteroidia bacterium]
MPTLYENPVVPYDYKQWASNHVWLHKQPFPLWLITISYYLFGVSELATRIPSILFSTFSVYLTYLIGKRFFNKKTGLLAAWFHATNGLIIELVAGRIATDHYDTMFLILIELGVWFIIRFQDRKKPAYLILSAICIAAAILTKWLPALIIYPIWYLFTKNEQSNGVITGVKQKISNFFLHLFLVVLFAGSWQVYILKSYPKEAHWEYYHQFLHMVTTLDKQTGGFFYFFNRLFVSYNELIFLILGFACYKIIKRQQIHFVYASLLVWILLPVLFFSFLPTKMQGYILFVAPAVFILSADYFFKLKEMPGNKRQLRLYALLQFCIIVLPLRYTIERMKFFESYERSRVWVEELKGIRINHKADSTVLFNFPYPIEAMFYTGFTAYESLPDSVQIENIKARGYTVLVYSNKKNQRNQQKFKKF